MVRAPAVPPSAAASPGPSRYPRAVDALDVDLQRGCVGGVRDRGGAVDEPPLVELEKALVEGLHPVVVALGHQSFEPDRTFHLGEGFGDGSVHREHLDSGHAAPTAGTRQQPQRDDAAQRTGEHRPHLRAEMRREELHEPNDGVHRADGRHGREHELADVRGLQRGARGAGVWQLADENDIRVLAQRVATARLRSCGRRVRSRAASRWTACRRAAPRSGLRWSRCDTQRLWFNWSTIAASVEVRPEPASPVTSTRPDCSSARRATPGGRPSASNPGAPGTTRRRTRPTNPRWRKALTRNRPSP